MNLYLTLVTLTTYILIPITVRQMDGTLISGEGYCSGVVVGPHQILSASHCVELPTKNITVQVGKEVFKAHVIRQNMVADLALYEVQNTTSPFKSFAKLGPEPKIGDEVYSVNDGEGYMFTFGKGYILNIYPEHEGEYLPMIMNSILIAPGASGSGLYNEKGELIGISTLSTPIGSSAVDTETIRQFLK